MFWTSVVKVLKDIDQRLTAGVSYRGRCWVHEPAPTPPVRTKTLAKRR